MSKSDKAFAQYLDLVRDHGAVLSNDRPAHLAQINLAGEKAMPEAMEAYNAAPGEIPECRLDTLFAPDYGVNIARVPMTADVAASFRCGVPQLNSLLAVVVNDIFRPTDILLRNLPQGLTVCSLRQVPAEFTGDAAAMLAESGENGDIADAISDALTHDGIYVRVAPHTEVDKAVQIVNIFNSPVPMLTPRRLLVHACEGSKVKILLCDHSQTPDVHHLNLQRVHIQADAGAEVEFYDIEESSAATRRLFRLRAIQERDSRLTVNTDFLSGGVSRNEFEIDVPGDHAHTSLSGLAIMSGDQICSDSVVLRHTGTHCTSRQVFKNALFDNARGAFGGRIVVEESARFTDAAQTNRNILESPAARMEASPQLEIYCDEVKCSHGATTGQLDERALFYMETRGIPRDEAKRMLTQAFMVDVIDNISFEVLRQRLHILVEKRLSGASADCNTCATACHNQSTAE